MAVKVESLKVLYKVTEYRDGCIYKTQALGEHWVPELSYQEECDLAKSLGGDMFGNISTKRMKELNFNNVRIVK